MLKDNVQYFYFNGCNKSSVLLTSFQDDIILIFTVLA